MDPELLLISVIIGIIVGAIVRASLLSELKTVAQKREAADYVKQGSFQLSQHSDLFLYKKTDRQARPQANPPQSPNNQLQIK